MGNDLKKWREKISVAEKKHKDEVISITKLLRNYYKGNQIKKIESGSYPYAMISSNAGIDNNVVVNMIYNNITALIPSILFRNPKIIVEPETPPTEEADTVSGAFFIEIMLNYYFRTLKLKREIRRCIFDACVSPWGIMKIGWTAKFEKIKSNKKLIVDELIKEDSIFVHRVSPLDFLVDPTCKNHHLNDADWIAFKWQRPLQDIKDTKNFKNTNLLKADRHAIPDKAGEKPVFEPYNADNDIKGLWDEVQGYEIWDKKNNIVLNLVFSGHQGKNEIIELERKKWPFAFEGFPVEILYFNENPDELYPFPDAYIYLKEQDELNMLESLKIEHIKKHAQQKYIESGSAQLTDNERLKLTHGGSGTIVQAQGKAADALFPLSFKNVAQDLYLAANQKKRDISEHAFISDFERGAAAKVDSATEASLIQQGISIQREYRQGEVEDFTVRILKKMFHVLQQTQKSQNFKINEDIFNQVKQTSQLRDKLVQIIGKEGELILLPWFNLSKKDIQGDYDFKISVGSMLPVNKETRKKDAVELVNIFANNPYIDPVEGTKKVLKAYEVPDIDKLMKDPQVVQQEQQMAQRQALEAEIAKDIPKRKVDLEKTRIKTQTNIQTTDMKNKADTLIALINSAKNKA